MLDFKPKLAAGMSYDQFVYPYILGNTNAAAIAANANNVSAIVVTNNIGAPFLITGFAIDYTDAATAQSSIRLESIQDSYNNRFILSGGLHLGLIGWNRVGTAPRVFRPLLAPTLLISGQSLAMFITVPAGVTVLANDLCLALEGVQSQGTAGAGT